MHFQSDEVASLWTQRLTVSTLVPVGAHVRLASSILDVSLGSRYTKTSFLVMRSRCSKAMLTL